MSKYAKNVGPSRDLRLAIVLDSTETACTVTSDVGVVRVPYANPFPRPRAERVSPGHLVAIAKGAEDTEIVIWRWFDAVVLNVGPTSVSLWEPLHGSVQATARHPMSVYRPGGRAYLSAGLPGAEWWVAGPVTVRPEDAEVDLAKVEQFFADLGLWDDIS